MVEKISAVKNPLSIIAIFAGISEISGTAVLPFIDIENQKMFIWFLMAFPTLLVLLFFGTLIFKHKVLYAPSDFKDESNFLKTFVPASRDEIEEKIKEESETNTVATPTVQARGANTAEARPVAAESFRENYRLAEELVCRDLSVEYKASVSREMRIPEVRDRMVFDGVFVHEGSLHIIEVKYFRRLIPSILMFEALYRIIHALLTAPEGLHKNAKIIVAIVTEEQGDEGDRTKLVNSISNRFSTSLIPVSVKVYDLRTLKARFNLS